MTGITYLIPNLLGGSAMPDPDELGFWKKTGIECIMNLILESYGSEILKKEREMGFDVYHFPIMDMSIPNNMKEMDDAVTWLKKQIEKKRKTVVHCFGGIGRTSTVLIGFLMSQGYSPEESFWKVSCMGISPQSHAQLFFLNRYYSHIKKQESRDKSLF